MKCLLVRLEAPLMAFGGTAVDSRGPVDPLPSASLLTGLLANALGYRRSQTDLLQALQDRMHYVVRIDRAGVQVTDFQTAQIGKTDKAWTTRGVPASRDGGQETYKNPHLRYRDFHADAAVTVALRLDPEGVDPSPEKCAEALAAPARPLFIGRKPCLPSAPVLLGLVEATDLLAALDSAALAEDADLMPRYFVPGGDESHPNARRWVGRRNWANDVHQGGEWWIEDNRSLSS